MRAGGPKYQFFAWRPARGVRGLRGPEDRADLEDAVHVAAQHHLLVQLRRLRKESVAAEVPGIWSGYLLERMAVVMAGVTAVATAGVTAVATADVTARVAAGVTAVATAIVVT